MTPNDPWDIPIVFSAAPICRRIIPRHFYPVRHSVTREFFEYWVAHRWLRGNDSVFQSPVYKMQHKQQPPPSRRISKSQPLLKSANGTTARLYLSINTFIDQSGFRLLWYFSFERDSVENKGAKLVQCQATKMWEVKYIFLEVSSSKYAFRYTMHYGSINSIRDLKYLKM